MKTMKILLVEDNEGDIILTTEALQTAAASNKIVIARDGYKALLYLTEAENVKDPLPDLILLDINLPRMNGHELLRNIKKNNTLKHIPVVMLSTSSSKNDIDNSYQNHANCYITKPNDLNEFFTVIERLEKFWGSTAQLPGRQSLN